MHQEKEKLHQDLQNEWYEQRLAYDIGGEFVWDGPSNWELFYLEKPRILFLNKESFIGYHPKDPAKTIVDRKAITMIWWAWIVKTNYDLPFGYQSPSSIMLLKRLYNNNFSRIAEIEVKKRNDEYPESSNTEIVSFAKNDAEFLARQIELIDPHVIICGDTFSSYQKIYAKDFAEYIPTFLAGDLKQSWKHHNRVVIDFFNPSFCQLGGGLEAYIDLWDEVLENGRVLKLFNW